MYHVVNVRLGVCKGHVQLLEVLLEFVDIAHPYDVSSVVSICLQLNLLGK